MKKDWAFGHPPDFDPTSGVCRRCGRPLEAFGDGFRHARQRCGAWMRLSRERCARRAGHRDSHRTRFALDCQNIAHTGRVPRSIRLAA